MVAKAAIITYNFYNLPFCFDLLLIKIQTILYLKFKINKFIYKSIYKIIFFSLKKIVVKFQKS
jgi:hypothetical protein